MNKARRLTLLIGTFLVALSLTVAGCGGGADKEEKKKEEQDKEKKEDKK